MAPEVLPGLAQAIAAVGRIDGLDEMLDELLARACALCGAQHATLMLLDPTRGDLAVRALRGYEGREQVLRGHRLALGQGLAGWAAREGRSVRVDDVDQDARYLKSHPQVRSHVGAPLFVRGQLVGVIFAESGRVAAFAAEHEQALGVLGAHAALAVVGETNGQRLQQRLSQLNALYRISRIASEREDLQAVLDEMLAVTQELIPEGYVALLPLDPVSRSLRVKAERGYFEGVESLSIPLGKGVTGRCAQTGQPIVVDDVAREIDYIPGVPGARSEIAVPLLAEGRVLGVLNAESVEPAAYGPDHLRTLSVVAQQAAVVLRAAQLSEETRRLAVTDPLTGLRNRRYFMGQLEETLRRARRYRESFAVVLLDVDRFKAVNDRHGHAAGDRVLKNVGRALGEWVRETDQVARIGGDEFAALLIQADALQVQPVVERLREAVAAQELRDGDAVVQTTLSAGIALYPAHGADTEELLSRADAALYDAKRLGRNRSVVASDLTTGAARDADG